MTAANTKLNVSCCHAFEFNVPILLFISIAAAKLPIATEAITSSILLRVVIFFSLLKGAMIAVYSMIT